MKTILLAILCVASAACFAQKHDNIWFLGYSGGNQSPANDIFGISIIKFDSINQIEMINNQTCNLNLRGANSGYCDSLGNLLFVCNGEKIYNADLELMSNGSGLNVTTGYGAVAPQGVLALNAPQRSNIYNLLVVETKVFSSELAAGIKLYNNEIQVNPVDAAESSVLYKKKIIISDSIEAGQLTAVKHANGRDWWILVPESFTNHYYTLLLDPLGITVVDTQAVGDAFRTGLGQSVFSPDGKKYLRVNGYLTTTPDHIYLYDFDRCTGKLSNPVHLTYENWGLGTGCAFSPDSRFFYAASATFIFQYDLNSFDLESSKTLVGEYDGYLFNGQTHATFGPARLAPDGKIYHATAGSTPFLHVIDHPDRKGSACGFRQRGISLFNYNNYSIPNHPNYRLGPIDGSSCDTLGLDNHPLCNWRWEQEDSLAPLRISFTDLSAYEPLVWHWNFGDGSASQDTSPVHVYAQEGIYEVCLSVGNANSSDTLCRTLKLLTSNTQTPTAAAGISVWPNPADEQLVVTARESLPGAAVVELFDVFGAKVFEGALSATQALSVDVGAFPQGLYFYSVRVSGERMASGKVVVARN